MILKIRQRYVHHLSNRWTGFLLILAYGLFYLLFHISSEFPVLAPIIVQISLIPLGPLVAIGLKGIYDHSREVELADATKRVVLWELKRNFVMLCKAKTSLVSTSAVSIVQQTHFWKHVLDSEAERLLDIYVEMDFYNLQILQATRLSIWQGGVEDSPMNTDEIEDESKLSNWGHRKQLTVLNKLLQVLKSLWPNEAIDWEDIKKDTFASKKELVWEPSQVYDGTLNLEEERKKYSDY